MGDESRVPRTNSLLQNTTRDRNTCHPPAIASERAAGGHRTTSVGCAHLKVLAKTRAESLALWPVSRLLKTRDIFTSRTNSNNSSSAFVVVRLIMRTLKGSAWAPTFSGAHASGWARHNTLTCKGVRVRFDIHGTLKYGNAKSLVRT